MMKAPYEAPRLTVIEPGELLDHLKAAMQAASKGSEEKEAPEHPPGHDTEAARSA